MLQSILRRQVAQEPAPKDYAHLKVASDLRLQHLAQGYSCELHIAVLATAVITSGVNALARPNSDVQPAMLRPYLETSRNHAGFLKLALLEILPNLTDMVASTEFYDAFSDARKITESYTAEAKSIGAARASAVYQRVLEDVWRDCCRSARFALDEFEQLFGPDLPPLYMQNHKVLKGLLGGAANGLSPCFDENQQLYAPPLPQQRRWPRRALLQDCVLSFDDMTYRSYARDASAGGLGLDRVPPMRLGQPVDVKLENGRTLSGTIVWSIGTSAGIKFAAPLPTNDPLLLG